MPRHGHEIDNSLRRVLEQDLIDGINTWPDDTQSYESLERLNEIRVILRHRKRHHVKKPNNTINPLPEA